MSNESKWIKRAHSFPQIFSSSYLFQCQLKYIYPIHAKTQSCAGFDYDYLSRITVTWVSRECNCAHMTLLDNIHIEISDFFADWLQIFVSRQIWVVFCNIVLMHFLLVNIETCLWMCCTKVFGVHIVRKEIHSDEHIDMTHSFWDFTQMIDFHNQISCCHPHNKCKGSFLVDKRLTF